MRNKDEDEDDVGNNDPGDGDEAVETEPRDTSVGEHESNDGTSYESKIESLYSCGRRAVEVVYRVLRRRPVRHVFVLSG